MEPNATTEDLLDWAWTLLANVNWDDQSAEWRNGAAKLRTEYHARLSGLASLSPELDSE